MKKYIIGLFSAICLMGAGCTEFEDFTPVDMGEGPAVTVTAEKTAVDAFKVTITPAEGTVYYSYIITDEAMTVDPDQLLQAKYEGSTLVEAAQKPSVSGTLSDQNLGATYYVYAVASNVKGVCGAVASASIALPDEEAPYLVDLPDGNKYVATNGGRSVVLTFNETVVRGNGAITYNVTKGDHLTSYASGAIESVAINEEDVTITLPESVVFDENEAVSYVFLDFAEGAFADAGGNESAALVGGVDEETQTVAAPYWEYSPNSSGSGIEIEIDEAKGYGEYVFAGLAATSQEVYAETLEIYPGAKIPELTGGQAFDHQYGIVGLGSNFMDDASRYGICPADISEDGSALQVETFFKDGVVLCDVPMNDGTRAYLVAVVGTYEQATGRFSMSRDEFVPFMPDAEEPAQLNTEKVIAYLIVDPTSGSPTGFAEVFMNSMILPYRLIASAQVAMSLEPSVNRAMKINSIKAQLQSSYNVPLMKVRR